MGGLSIYFFSVVIDQFMKLRLKLVIPPQLVQTVDGLLGEKKFKEAYDALKGDKSLFARSVTAGVERLSHGIDRGMEAMVGVAEDGKMTMEHKASVIATVGQISPMLGLLGTVLGMVLAFQEIAKGGQPKPAELADNIGIALISTLEGLILAIPAIFFFGLFRNKISRLIFEVESLGESFLWRFAAALKK
jgi:biopolymer transport protein ExbB